MFVLLDSVCLHAIESGIEGPALCLLSGRLVPGGLARLVNSVIRRLLAGSVLKHLAVMCATC